MSLSTVDAPSRARATGYGRKPSTHDAVITEVGPGTPLG